MTTQETNELSPEAMIMFFIIASLDRDYRTDWAGSALAKWQECTGLSFSEAQTAYCELIAWKQKPVRRKKKR